MKRLEVFSPTTPFLIYIWFLATNSDIQEIIPVHAQTSFNKQFLDLLKQIFVYDPNARITAKEALKHPWFSTRLTDDGTEAARIRRDRIAAAESAAAALQTSGR